MMQIAANMDLRGVKVRYDGFTFTLQGSYRHAIMVDDWELEVESGEMPLTRLLASRCEAIEESEPQSMKTNETFVCSICKHELPASYRHEEKSEVCFLDYISEADEKAIKAVVDALYK